MSRVKTGVKEIDKQLKGGLVKGRQATFFGPPNIGKTLFCLQIGCKLSIEEDAPVIYLDTEGDFPDDVTLQTYTDFLGQRFNGDPDIRMKFVPDIVELMNEFGKDLNFIEQEGKEKQEITLEESKAPINSPVSLLIEQENAAGLILDSFSGPIEERFVSQSQNFPARASVIKSLAGALKILAEDHNVPVIETVHQTKNPTQPWLQAQAIGGDSYGYAVKTRILVKEGSGTARKVLVTRHPGVHEEDFKEIIVDIEKDYGIVST